uniref:Uncharacterized protein n=1 Tax=Vitrella brassicaformis TaxID=1169539 RepID=A0A7S1JT17_9ALVE
MDDGWMDGCVCVGKCPWMLVRARALRVDASSPHTMAGRLASALTRTKRTKYFLYPPTAAKWDGHMHTHTHTREGGHTRGRTTDGCRGVGVYAPCLLVTEGPSGWGVRARVHGCSRVCMSVCPCRSLFTLGCDDACVMHTGSAHERLL